MMIDSDEPDDTLEDVGAKEAKAIRQEAGYTLAYKAWRRLQGRLRANRAALRMSVGVTTSNTQDYYYFQQQ
jgi:hypothetical protein